jgi:hypothetical protein
MLPTNKQSPEMEKRNEARMPSVMAAGMGLRNLLTGPLVPMG